MGCGDLFFLSTFLIGLLAVLGEDAVKSTRDPILTADSATVYWDHVQDCDGGYCEEYALILLRSNEPYLNSSVGGTVTNDNSFTFGNLEAGNTYTVKVFGMSSARINESRYQEINFTTKTSGTAQPPEVESSPALQPSFDEGVCKQGMPYQYHASCVSTPVRDMTVYKTTHNKISVKWTKPEKINGGWLTGFQVYRQSPSGGLSSRFQAASPCREFSDSDIYCHTYEGLRPDTEYTFSVTAKNAFSRLYSDATYLKAKTNDEPGLDEPTNLQVVNLTPTSFDLTWSLPDESNKLPSSFLITVTETERFDKENCCNVFPQLEIPVTQEKTYKNEVAGLNPASTYEVKVRSKSGYSLGEPETRFVQTPPPKMGLEGGSLLVKVPVGNFRFIYQRPAVNDTQLYRPLIRGPKMLLVLTTDQLTAKNSGVKDEEVYAFLQSTLKSSFFVIMDLDNKEVKPYINLESEGAYKGQWGDNTWTLNNGTACYRLAGVQVSKYAQTYGLDYYINSEAFQPKNLLSPFTYGQRDLECYTKHGHI